MDVDAAAAAAIDFDCIVIVGNAWRVRLSLVGTFGIGRIWLAGDSVH
ncbi:hypothetical protein SAMN04244553_1162 [Nocardia amikacinitolerans]|uniref:Uncharacterized protein n=1 Tax=Nocardia amikacinitolerans TaxID=756689 RepID=A0A285L3L8_9NOCA|nr:hypothetical protein [Nocardia amikacinitolerans]SNY78011.1 hypothetical protein SAMN04244553_1162 [Nocardia amikacinitolerans]